MIVEAQPLKQPMPTQGIGRPRGKNRKRQAVRMVDLFGGLQLTARDTIGYCESDLRSRRFEVDWERQADYTFGCSEAKCAVVGVTVIQRVLYREGPSGESSILKARGLHLFPHPERIFCDDHQSWSFG